MIDTVEPESEWKEIGTIYVDSASLIIGDPMSILSDNQYEKWCNQQEDLGNPLYNKSESIEKTSKKPRNMITCSTGFGDGDYRVFAKIVDFGDEGKRVMEVRISFEYASDYDPKTNKESDISMRELYGKVLQRHGEQYQEK
jgi:hypothetical protein